MDRYLKSGDKLKLNGIDGQFEIREIIGRGSSCVVYKTDFYNELGMRSEHLLKEFNPKDFDLERDKEGKLVLKNDADVDLFDTYKANFIKGYSKQETLRRESRLKNFTANIQNSYEDHGTVYIDMSVTEGVSYDEITEGSLFDLARRIKVLAQVVGLYHEKGYLHLDLKPSNIYVRPENETCEDVLLFDFDSMVEKDDLSPYMSLSYTEDWAALELKSSSRRRLICEATDIFAIGEIFFVKLMGRHSETWERRSFSKYEYDYSMPIFQNVNPAVNVYLDELFRGTLCNTVSCRFQVVCELISVLDKIIETSNPDKPFLKSSCPEPLDFFVGREDKIEEIHDSLQNNSVLFLSGVGGIGKSELAKNYAKQYLDEYDVKIFAPYTSSMSTLLADDSAFPIHNFYRYQKEQLDMYAKRKLRELKKLCNERTLIIIDNFDCVEEEELKEILNLNCHIVITTRMNFAEYNRGQIVVDKIADDKIMDVFCHYYTKPMSEEDLSYVQQIIEIVCGHTMTIELLAKQMMAGRVKASTMLERLKNHGIIESGKESVGISKDDKFERGSAFEHIKALFDLSKLDENEQYILANLALMPYTGISTELFYEWCELKSYETINQLVVEGWIRFDNMKDRISLHPVVSDVIANNIIEIKLKENTMLINIVNGFEKQQPIDMSELSLAISKKLVKYNHTEKTSADFLVESSKVYWGYGYINDAILYCKKAAGIYESIHNLDAELMIAYNRIGWLNAKAGYLLEAEKYIDAVISMENPQKANVEVAEAYDNMGTLFKLKMEFGKAVTYYNKALLLRKDLFGERHSKIAESYNNIAGIYRRLGNIERAKTFYYKAMEIWIDIFGEKNRHVVTVYNNLGSLFSEQNDYDIAEMYLKKALDITLCEYGEKHFKTAVVYNSLGILYYQQTNVEPTVAEQNFLMAHKIWQDLMGELNDYVATSYHNLGSFYAQYREFEKAENHFFKALEIKKYLYEENHSSFADTYSQMAYLYNLWNKLDLAEYYYKLSLNLWNNIYGCDNNRVASGYIGIGVLCSKKNEYKEAEYNFLKALTILKNIYGERHKDIATIHDNLGDLYLREGKRRESEENIIKAYEIRKELFGEESLDVARSLAGMGNFYYLGNYMKEAMEYYSRAYEVRKNILGEESPITLKTKESMRIIKKCMEEE